MENRNINKGEWVELTHSDDLALYEVILPCGETHEVVTFNFNGTEYPIEVE